MEANEIATIARIAQEAADAARALEKAVLDVIQHEKWQQDGVHSLQKARDVLVEADERLVKAKVKLRSIFEGP